MIGVYLLLMYFAYNVAAYGAPELKVLAVVGLLVWASFGSEKRQLKTKVSMQGTDK